MLDGWRHLGSVRDPARIAALLDNPEAPFTRDTYRILRSHLRRHPEMDERLTRGGSCRFLTTDLCEHFDGLARIFMGEPIVSERVEIG